MLICTRCGQVTAKEDTEYLSFQHEIQDGIRVDVGYDIEYKPCKCCGSREYAKATLCKVCGKWFDDEDEGLEVCEGCIEKAETIDVALAMGEANLEPVNINGFIKFSLTEKEINSILCDYIKTTPHIANRSSKIVDYCEEDRGFFAEWIADKYGD